MHYPDSSYLLRKGTDRRFRVLDGAGLPDPQACAVVAGLLPVAAGLTPEQRARGAATVARLQKAATGATLDQGFGFPVAIEVPVGGLRSGSSPDGTAWSQPLIGCAYGFLPGTVELDRAPVDVFRGPDDAAPLVYVATQLHPDGTLDERKLLLGFGSSQEAIQVFLANGPAWRLGDLHAFPVGLLRGLLGYEAVAPGALVKALGALGSADGRTVATLGPDGLLLADVERVMDARCRKGVTGLGTFEGGGLKLPAQGGATPRRVATDQGQFADDAALAKARDQRLTCAIDSAALWKGTPALPLGFPNFATHPANTAPLSGTYDTPNEVGGWLGWIEPADESWIAFVNVDGMALLWTQRDMGGEHAGAVIGDPVQFQRDDLARPDLQALTPAAGQEQAGKSWKHAVRALPVAKSLGVDAPPERRIVYGVVLEPEPNDGNGDGHHETYSAAEIEQAAHNYCASFLALNDAHGRFLTREQIAVVETYIAPADLLVEGSTIRRGAWVLAAKVFDDALWARVLAGELNAWSIEGYSERYCTTCEARMHLVTDALRGERWVCPSVAMGRHR